MTAVSDMPHVARQKVAVGSICELLNCIHVFTGLNERILRRTQDERKFELWWASRSSSARGEPVEPLNDLNNFCRMLLNQEIALVRPAVPLRGWLVLFRGA
jgi:hypothetical protein